MLNHKDSIARLLLNKGIKVEDKELTQKYSNACANLGHLITQIEKVNGDVKRLTEVKNELLKQKEKLQADSIELLLQIDQLSKGIK